MSTFTPLLAQLKHAVELAEQIEALQAELASVMRTYCAGLTTRPSSASARHRTFKQPPALGSASNTKANRVSPEGRAKIAEAQKRRWARWRQA
ncbi:MAG: hypothetical protein ACO1TE_06180 [Prosthecobacter sp.]